MTPNPPPPPPSPPAPPGGPPPPSVPVASIAPAEIRRSQSVTIVAPSPLPVTIVGGLPTPPRPSAAPQPGGGGLSGLAAGLSAGFGVMHSTLTAVLGQITSLGAKASPTAGATLERSFDLLKASIGSLLVPTMMQLSSTIQTLAKAVPDPKTKIAGGLTLGDTIGALFGGPQMRLLSKLMGDKDLKNTSWFDTWAGRGPKPKPLLSYAGLPQPVESSAEQYYQRSQQAVLGTGPLDQEIQQKQLENLEAIGGLLKDIRDQEKTKERPPKFR